MSNAPKTMTIGDFARLAHLPHAAARNAVTAAGITPHMTYPWGDKIIARYLASDLEPMAAKFAAAYHQRKLDKAQAKATASAPPVVSTTFDSGVALDALARRLNALAESLVLIGAAIDELKAQQKLILDAISSPESV